ncbi:MAG: AEC family transporter [Nitratireductor sp.]
MDALLQSLLPIFLIIILGGVLKRHLITSEEGWVGMERLGYFVLFPILLARTLYRTDFASLSAGTAALAFLIACLALLATMYLIRAFLQPLLGLEDRGYSSFYQSTTRWNAFVILAIAEQMGSGPWLAIVAIAIGTMIVPINIVNIMVLTALGRGSGNQQSFVMQVIRNPLIVGVAIGLGINASGLSIPGPLDITLELLARITLPLGLLLIGAGLRVRMPGRDMVAVALSSALKLFMMPFFFGTAAWLLGISGQEFMAMVLCGTGPTAMNGYLLARQMGGDAPMFAAMVTAQTALSFFTIPLVMAIAQWVGG